MTGLEPVVSAFAGPRFLHLSYMDWSAKRESNSRSLLGRQICYPYITGAGTGGGNRTHVGRLKRPLQPNFATPAGSVDGIRTRAVLIESQETFR